MVQAGVLPHDDELLPLTLTVIGASPTAMQLSTIASLVGQGEKEVANLLFWQARTRRRGRRVEQCRCGDAVAA